MKNWNLSSKWSFQKFLRDEEEAARVQHFEGQEEKEREKQLFENWKVQKTPCLPIWHLSTAKNEHVKLVFSKNSQQCWKQMMLKELFNFLKKFNSPWDCKKTTKVPTKNCHKFPCDDEKMRTENTVSNIITSGHSFPFCNEVDFSSVVWSRPPVQFIELEDRGMKEAVKLYGITLGNFSSSISRS